jgi:hypothetical protein
MNCSGLTSVSIHNGVGETHIGFAAFVGFSDLSSFSIPGGVKSLDSSVFTIAMSSGSLD